MKEIVSCVTNFCVVVVVSALYVLLNHLRQPYNRVAVGRLVVVDRSKPCRLNNKYKWTLEAPDWQDMQRTQLVDAAKIQRQLRTVREP